MDGKALYGAVEAGGTKFLCGIGSFEHGSLDQVRIPTATPDETLGEVCRFFQTRIDRFGPMAALGIGSFGPLDLDPRSKRYGSLTTTPKPGWQGVDLLRAIALPLDLPVAINSDVNAAALAEARLAFGDEPGLLAYVTVGTGIGVGFAENGRVWTRKALPEAGHLVLRRHPRHEGFPGVCPFHGDCVEGLASGPAIAAAWGAPLDRLASDHPAWRVEADYIAQLCAALLLTAAPDRIVIGGGVFNQHALFDAVRARTLAILSGYRDDLQSAGAIDAMIHAPASPIPSGLGGAYLLAAAAAASRPVSAADDIRRR